MAVYSFTETDLERGILNLKCAAAAKTALYIQALKDGEDCTNYLLTIDKMDSILFALTRYNYSYYAGDEINCLTIDETAVLLQRAKSIAEECACYTPVRPVTLQPFHF